jgi:hypothetical protein
MAALTADRALTVERDSAWDMIHNFLGADSTQFYKGGMVCVDSADGKLKKGATSTTLRAIGRCEENYLTGVGNTRKIRCKSGIFKFQNSSAGDLIAATEIGATCFIVDDQTVAKTNGGATRSVAGIVYDVDTDGVWVAMKFPLS